MINREVVSEKPYVCMPNPYYQIYGGATLFAGAKPHFLNCSEENNFQMDLENVAQEVWEKCQLLVLCSPSNPTGKVMTKDELCKVVKLSKEFGFKVLSDECYIDIYETNAHPPAGLLECDDLSEPNSKSVVFHSLSKRSNLAGLRSGFICAGKEVIEKLSLYRTYHGVTLSFPTQKASTWAWSDKDHVQANRLEYDKKYKAAISCLDSIEDLERPQGGFYFWLKLPCDDEIFAKTLYQEESVLSLPGSYLATENNGSNPGKGYLRLAVVHDIDTITKAFNAVNKTLKRF